MKQAIDNTIEMISGLRDDIKADEMYEGPKVLSAVAEAINLTIQGEDPTAINSAIVKNFTKRHKDTIPDAAEDGVKLAKQIMKAGIPAE